MLQLPLVYKHILKRPLREFCELRQTDNLPPVSFCLRPIRQRKKERKKEDKQTSKRGMKQASKAKTDTHAVQSLMKEGKNCSSDLWILIVQKACMYKLVSIDVGLCNLRTCVFIILYIFIIIGLHR